MSERVSWIKTADPTAPSSFIREAESVDLSASESLANRIYYSESFVRNTGVTKLYESGFFISADPINNSYTALSLEEALAWSAIEDPGGKPYGVFTVFGYQDSSGVVSYIDKFKNDTITADELRAFQHSWTQGTRSFNKIKKEVCYTYQDGTYSQSNVLPVYSNINIDNAAGENNGILKILFGVRLPDTANVGRILINQEFYYQDFSEA